MTSRRVRLSRWLALAWAFLGVLPLAAQQDPNKQKADELIKSAQQSEMLGYVLAAAGFLVIIAGVVYAILTDKKKKRRKADEPEEEP